MKILISSKTLYEHLKHIDLEIERVQEITIENNNMILITQNNNIKIPVSIIEFKANSKQADVRWDFIKHLVKNINEQPVVLHINDNITKAIFEF